jgi:hypothetical protein
LPDYACIKDLAPLTMIHILFGEWRRDYFSINLTSYLILWQGYTLGSAFEKFLLAIFPFDPKMILILVVKPI